HWPVPRSAAARTAEPFAQKRLNLPARRLLPERRTSFPFPCSRQTESRSQLATQSSSNAWQTPFCQPLAFWRWLLANCPRRRHPLPSRPSLWVVKSRIAAAHLSRRTCVAVLAGDASSWGRFLFSLG